MKNMIYTKSKNNCMNLWASTYRMHRRPLSELINSAASLHDRYKHQSSYTRHNDVKLDVRFSTLLATRLAPIFCADRIS